MQTIMVKLGGSLITDKAKPFTANTDVIKRLAKEIHEARQKKEFRLVVGHGGGSFPHVPAKKYETSKGTINSDSWKGFVLVQDAASQLNRLIVNALLDAGEKAVAVQPSACCIAKNDRIIYWYLDPIKKMLEEDLVPVPYGDVAIDVKKGCCIISTEEIFSYLADKLKVTKIIAVGKVDGVFTSDPTKNPNARMIPEITTRNFNEIKKFLAGSDGIDVTGGMLHKVEKLLELAEARDVVITNGNKKDNLKKCLLGENIGTLIKAD